MNNTIVDIHTDMCRKEEEQCRHPCVTQIRQESSHKIPFIFDENIDKNGRNKHGKQKGKNQPVV